VHSLTQKGKLYVLDRYVFESLCLCKPHEKVNKVNNEDDFSIILPIFPESVIRPDFSQWFINAINRYNIPANVFRLDIIYRWPSTYDKFVYHSLDELHAAGFRIGLKEVGDSNYPLDLLSQINLDAFVISERLVIDGLTNTKKRRLVYALKSMCANMGVRMEADRIDSREKLQFVSDVGFQVLQGNFLTKSIPIDQFWEYKRRVDGQRMLA